jgi:hypothetical protein
MQKKHATQSAPIKVSGATSHTEFTQSHATPRIPHVANVPSTMHTRVIVHGDGPRTDECHSDLMASATFSAAMSTTKWV